MPVVFSALMCHAPIVLPAVGRDRALACARTTRAMIEVARRALASRPERLVLISPHSPRRKSGFGAWKGRHVGDLAAFRAPQVRIELPDAGDVAESLHLAALTDGPPLDHGAVVPLSFLWDAGWRGPTAILSLPWDGRGGEEVGAGLAKLPGRTAVIASGDMSHKLTPDAPAGFEPLAADFDRAFVEALRGNDWDAALFAPHRDVAAEDVVDTTRVAMAAVGSPVNSEVLSYEGPFGVGYTEAIFFDPSPPLYAVARCAIRAHLAGERYPPPVGGPPPAGVFVTLTTRDGALRGCIGRLGPTQGRLFDEVAATAPDAATADPRFPAVTAAEMDDLQVEVSVLEPSTPVRDVAELDPRRFGVVMTWSGKRGVLLPDLHGVDSVEQQLAIVRRKAGIPAGVDAQLQKFTVRKEASP